MPLTLKDALLGSTIAGGAFLLLRRGEFGVAWKKPARGLVSSGWGDARDGGSRFHRGIDIRGNVGDPIWAAASGVVRRVDLMDDSGAGRFVEIEHKGGALVTRYLHLGKIGVEPGDRVRGGQQIATMGRSGVEHADTHLHAEVVVCSAELVAEFQRNHPGLRPPVPSRHVIPGCVPVPAESVLPVDGYFDRVIERAEERGVRLR